MSETHIEAMIRARSPRQLSDGSTVYMFIGLGGWCVAHYTNWVGQGGKLIHLKERMTFEEANQEYERRCAMPDAMKALGL